MAEFTYEGLNKHQDASQRIQIAEKEIENLQRLKLKVRNLRKSCFPGYYVYDDHFLNKPISMYRIEEVNNYISEVETRINKWEEILLEQNLKNVANDLSEQFLGVEDDINDYEDQDITGSHQKDNRDHEPTEQRKSVTPDSCYYSESGDSIGKHSVQCPMNLFTIPPNQVFYILVNTDCTYHNNVQ